MADSLFGRNSLPVWASASTIVSPGLPGDGYPTRVAPDANAQLYGHVPGRSFHGRRENHVNYEVLESLRTLRRTRVRHAAMHWIDANFAPTAENAAAGPTDQFLEDMLSVTYSARDGKWYATVADIASNDMFLSCDGVFWRTVSSYTSYFADNNLHPISVVAHPITGGALVISESNDGANHYFSAFEYLPGKLRLTLSSPTVTDVSALFGYASTSSAWIPKNAFVTANLTTGNRMVVANGDAILSFANPAAGPSVYVTADFPRLAVTRGLANDIVVATGVVSGEGRFMVSDDGGVTWFGSTTFVGSATSPPHAAYDAVTDKWWFLYGFGNILARYSCSTPGVPNSVADYVVPAAAVDAGSAFSALIGRGLVAHDEIVVVQSPPVIKVIDTALGGPSSKSWAVGFSQGTGGTITLGGTDTNGYTCPRIVSTSTASVGTISRMRVSEVF